MCGKRICVHYATRGADAPPSRRWALRTLRTLGRVWDHEVDALHPLRKTIAASKAGKP